MAHIFSISKGFSMNKSLKVALALVGLTVGAGFASGQEVIQYFLAFGYRGIIGAAIAGATYALVTGIDRRDEDITGVVDPEDLKPTLA